LRERADSGEPIGAKPLQKWLTKEFGFTLPLGVIRSLLRDAVEEGKVREEQKLYFPVPEQLEGCDLNLNRADFGRRFAGLSASLAAFASDKHELTWSTVKAKALLIEYADRFSSDVLASAINGRQIPKLAPHNVSAQLFVVHEFVLAAYESSAEDFDFLVGLVRARMLSDSLYFDIRQGQEEGLSQVNVYLDGPVLLYLLGNAGEDIRAPYLELVKMLTSQVLRSDVSTTVWRKRAASSMLQRLVSLPLSKWSTITATLLASWYEAIEVAPLLSCRPST